MFDEIGDNPSIQGGVIRTRVGKPSMKPENGLRGGNANYAVQNGEIGENKEVFILHLEISDQSIEYVWQ